MAELHTKHDVTVEWLPYELRPEPVPLPDLSGPQGEQFRHKWERGVAPLAAQLGVEMRFPPYKPRSRGAHEVAEYARERGTFEAVRVALFRAFFVDGRDIGDREVLIDVGASAGLDPVDLLAALDSGRHTARVVALESVSARLGVSAVPTIVIGDLAVEGVRPYEVLRRVLEQAERDGAGGAAS